MWVKLMNSPASLFQELEFCEHPMPSSSYLLLPNCEPSSLPMSSIWFAWCVSRGMKTWVKNMEMGMVRFVECALWTWCGFPCHHPLFSLWQSITSQSSCMLSRQSPRLQYWLHCCLAMWFSVHNRKFYAFSVLKWAKTSLGAVRMKGRKEQKHLTLCLAYSWWATVSSPISSVEL